MMATTAYSKSFERELDVGQLLALMSDTPGEVRDWPEAGLPSEWRDRIRSDVVCSSCGAADATIVMPSKAKASGAAVRQAHFRFVRPDGADAHSPLCEFYGNRDGEVRAVEQLVDFGKAKTAETRRRAADRKSKDTITLGQVISALAKGARVLTVSQNR